MGNKTVADWKKVWQMGTVPTSKHAALLKKKSPKCRRKCGTFWKIPHFWNTVADWEKEPHLGDFHENSLKEIEFAGSPTSVETVADLEKKPHFPRKLGHFSRKLHKWGTFTKKGHF